MTREEFDKLVRTVEHGVGRDPERLKQRVALWAAIGYAGLTISFGIVLFFAAICFLLSAAAQIEVKIGLWILGSGFLLGGLWSVGRVLLVRITPPQGRLVTFDEAPVLFAILDELGTELKSPRFHKVLIVPGSNAAVVQVPRLGVLGWSRNYLLLGLAMLDVFSPDEIRAVLAHEFAHLSRKHGRFSRWIYRLRRSWEKVFEELAKPRFEGEVSIRPLISKFVQWFWPRFNAHAFVLSRANEYEADAISVKFAGVRHVASALLKSSVHVQWIDEKFWPDFWQLAEQQATVPNEAFTAMKESFRNLVASAESSMWMQRAYVATTTNADTHPCLSDRLRAFACEAEMAGVALPKLTHLPSPSAFDVFFGNAGTKVRSDVESLWRKECEPFWKDRHAKASVLKRRLKTIDLAPAASDTDPDTLWDKAHVFLEMNKDTEAEPLLRQVLAINSLHPGANFHLGRILLDKHDPAGERHLNCVIEADEDWIPHGCEVLHAYYRRTGQPDGVRRIEARLDHYEQTMAIARQERSSVSASDRLIPHGLSAGEVSDVLKIIGADKDILQAHAAQKALQHLPKQKFFLLCVRPRTAWHRIPNRNKETALVNRLTQSLRLPGRVFIFTSSGTFRSLARRIERMPGSRIFPA